MIARKEWLRHVTVFGYAGAPCSGKGTVSLKVERHLERCKTIPVSGLLASEISLGTDIGMCAKSYVDGHEMVPDEIILKLVSVAVERAYEVGYLIVALDGIPRTPGQVHAVTEIFDGRFPIFYLDVDENTAIERMLSRDRESTQEECRKRLGVFRKETLPPLLAYERMFPKFFTRVNTMEHSPKQCARFIVNKLQGVLLSRKLPTR